MDYSEVGLGEMGGESVWGIGVVDLLTVYLPTELGASGRELELGAGLSSGIMCKRRAEIIRGPVVGFRVVGVELNRVEGFGKEERLETAESRVRSGRL